MYSLTDDMGRFFGRHFSAAGEPAETPERGVPVPGGVNV